MSDIAPGPRTSLIYDSRNSGGVSDILTTNHAVKLSTTVEIVAVCLTTKPEINLTISTTVEIVAVCLTTQQLFKQMESTTVEIVAVCLTGKLPSEKKGSTTVEIVAVCLTIRYRGDPSDLRQ